QKRGAHFPEPGNEISGELPIVRPLLDDHEGQATGEARLPLPVHTVGREEAEHLPHRDTGVEIALPPQLPIARPAPPATIVAVLRVVERQFHPVGKGHGARLTFRNSLKDEFKKGRILRAGRVTRRRAHGPILPGPNPDSRILPCPETTKRSILTRSVAATLPCLRVP